MATSIKGDNFTFPGFGFHGWWDCTGFRVTSLVFGNDTELVLETFGQAFHCTFHLCPRYLSSLWFGG